MVQVYFYLPLARTRFFSAFAAAFGPLKLKEEEERKQFKEEDERKKRWVKDD